MPIIEFIDETGNELDHDRDSLSCKACGEKASDRFCDYCDGILHIHIVEGSTFEAMRCSKCGFEVGNDGKYY